MAFFYAKFVLKNVHADVFKIETNLLQNVLRYKFGIEENQKLIIIGNPPYNDKTSIIKMV